MTHAVGKVPQHLGEALTRGLASRGDVESPICDEIVVGYDQSILKQPGILGTKISDGRAVPDQSGAIRDGFGAHKIFNRRGQDGRSAADLTWRKPEDRNFLAARRQAEAAGAPADHQKYMVGRKSLVRHHGMSQEATPGRSRKDRSHFGGSKSVEESRVEFSRQRHGFRMSHL